MGARILFAVMSMVVTVPLHATALEREMNMVLYMHDNERNECDVVSSGGIKWFLFKRGQVWNPSSYHQFHNRGPNSEFGSHNIVGRAQGTYVNTNLVTGLDFFMAFTLIFDNLEYSGSTLELQGTDRFDQPQCEYAVVGGTRKFRFAHGYVVVTTESNSGPNVVLKFNTTFLIP